MSMQTQVSNLAKRFGQRIAIANETAQAAPASLGGQQRLPPGVKEGIARLQVMTIGEYQDDKNGPGTKGMPFFRIACVAIHPEMTAEGRRVSGIQTSKIIPLCDLPKKGNREATTAEQGYSDMTAMIHAFGVTPCKETRQTDPTGIKAISYYAAAMQMLCNPQKARFIKFSTRSWQPPRPITAKPEDPNPDPVTIENWEGVATDEEVARMNGKYDPAAGASDEPPASEPTATVMRGGQHIAGPAPTTDPPTQSSIPFNESSEFTNAQAHIHSMSPESEKTNQTFTTLEDEVTYLVSVAMDDPDGNTEEGREAQLKLLDMAHAGGWSEEQTLDATWEEVGDMVLNPSDEPEPASATAAQPKYTVGSKWKFHKRTKDGAKYRGKNGEEMTPLEVEVDTVNDTDQTCTVKNVKDGKLVTDVRTRQPIVVKFEWLE